MSSLDTNQRRDKLVKKPSNTIPKKSRFEKKSEVLQKPLGIYQAYIKTLLGFELEQEEDFNYNCILKNFKKDLSEDIEIFPDCVFSLINPDYKYKNENHDQCMVNSSIELFELLQSGLRINQKSLDDLLLLKAIESIYFNLPYYDACYHQKKDPTILLTEENQEQKHIREKDLQQQNLLYEKSDIRYHIDKNEIIKNYVSQLEKQFHNLLLKDIHANIMDCLTLNYKELKQTLLKKWRGGQYLENQEDMWIRSGTPTQDVSTLIRNALIIKLNKGGFNIQSFLSGEGHEIFVMLNMQDSNLKIVADQGHVLKQLNFWFTDLFSLEPVDKSFRPLRINNRIWKSSDFEVSDLFLYLKPQMIRLIQQINFKRIARETNQSSINSQLFEYGKLDFSEKDDGPTDEEWIAYHKYLTHLEKCVRQFRQSQLIDNELACLLNKQITSLQIYQKRNSSNKEIQNLNYQNLQDHRNYEHLEMINQIQMQADRVMDEFSNFQFSLQIPPVKALKLLKKESVSLNYLYSFQEALRVANGEQIKLYNLWERSEIPPFDMYHPYQMPNKENTKTQQAKQELSWRKYVKNENNQISLFSSQERLKLVYQKVSQELDLSIMHQLGIIKQIFCLNDHYELFGQCSNVQAQITLDTRFFKKKPFQLIDEWKLDYLRPWISPCDLICGYYGEKIGLYFYFMSYFTEMTTPLAFSGLACSLIQWIIWDNESDFYILVTIIFAFVQIHWSNVFTDLWKQKQIYFNLKYGQNDQDQQQVQRSKFKGKHIRSLVNDQLNSIEVLYHEYLKRTLVSSMLLFFFILFYIGIIVSLFVFTVQLHNKYQEELKQFDIATIEVTSAAAMNFIAQLIADNIFDKIACQLTEYENYKTVESYETSFVLKKFIFQFFSYIAPLLFLDYLNQPLNLYCARTNCERHVKYYFSAIVILILFKQIVNFCIFLFKLTKIKIKSYDYNEIDIMEFVEDQSSRQPYSQDFERYGTMQDYMELFVLISFLSIFGYTFPFSFFILWISNIMQIQVKKNTFLYCLQRPWPKNESSLGIWNFFLEIISLICLLTNTGVVTIQYNKQFGYELIMVFLGVLIFNCFGKFFIGAIFGQIPDALGDLMKRHKYLIKATIQNKIKEGKSQENKDALKRFPILKVYGTLNSAESGKFETVSSDDELHDHYEIPEIKQKLNVIKVEQYTKNLDKQYLGEFQFTKILEYFSQRDQNWAFKCVFKNQKEKQKLRLLLKIYTLLYKSQLLTKYRQLWTDRRVSQRFVHMRRKIIQLRNLDYRRYLIISSKLNQMRAYYDEKAQQRFRKDFQLIGQQEDDNGEENIEYTNLVKKYQRYVEKHAWLNTRKVILLKIKALTFKGFRKQVVKKPSLQLIQEFYKITQIIENLEPENPLQPELDSQIDYSALEKIQFSDFMDIFNNIDLKQKVEWFLPLSSQRNNSSNYFIEDIKSIEFKNIVDQCKDSSIFQKTTTVLEEIILSYFQIEQFPIPQIKFIKHMHDNIWIVKMGQSETPYLLQFIQIKHGEQIQLQKYADNHEGILYAESKNYFRIVNTVDQIDDFYIKGYCICIYEAFEPKSFLQVLKYRKTYGIPYTEAEIKQFLHAALNLLKLADCKSLTSRNIFLIRGEYYILNSMTKVNSFFELGKIVLEMLYLEEIEDIKQYFEKLTHPLKWLINELLFLEDNLQKLQDFIQKQYCFTDIKFEIEHHQKQQFHHAVSYQAFTWSMLHKINLNFRMKQFHDALHLTQEYEDYIKKEVYQINESPFSYFCIQLIEDLNSYLLSSHSLKKNLDIILIYYYQIAAKFQIKYDVTRQLNYFIDILKKLTFELRLIIKQLISNINVANLNQTEQCIILKTIQNDSEQSSQLLSKQRQFLLAQLRKNLKLIDNILLFEQQVNRFLNQFYALFALQQYFSGHYEFAKLTISSIIETQQKIMHKQKLPEILSEAQELSPSQFNFDQLSPGMEREEQEIVKEEVWVFNINSEIKTNPLYAIQYIYYLYLQVIILHDCKNELYHMKQKEFLNYNFKDIPAYTYFQQLISSLQFNFKITEKNEQFFKQESQCELGRYSILWLKTNMENKQYIQSELEESTQMEFNWRQLLSYNNLKCSLKNKTALLYILKQTSTNEQMKILLNIRIIHFLLKLYDYCPINFKQRVNILNKDLLGQIDLESTSKILQLQQLHKLYTFGVKIDYFSNINNETASWIFHQGLIQLRIFIYQSYCYSFSKRHFENIAAYINYQEEIYTQISKLMIQGDSTFSKAKNYQILQQPVENMLINTQSDYFGYHQYFLTQTRIMLLQKKKLSDIYQCFVQYLNEYFINSIFILGLIQIYYEFEEIDMANLIVYFTKKLLDNNAVIFNDSHEGFKKDIQIIEAVLKQKRQQLIKPPYNRLYHRNELIEYFEDETLNARYFLFNLPYYFNMQFSQSIMEDFITVSLVKLTLPLQQILKTAFCSIKAECGDEEILTLLKIVSEYKFLEGSLTWAFHSHFLCRYYISMVDMENAYEYSLLVLSYLYQLDLQQGFYIKENKNGFKNHFICFQSEKNIIKQICQPKSIPITESIEDALFDNVNDDFFVIECILNHLEILSRSQFKMPTLTILLQFQLKLQNQRHRIYFWKVIAYVLYRIATENLIPEALLQIQDNKKDRLQELKEIRRLNKKRRNAKVLLREITQQEFEEFDYQNNLINFQMNCYKLDENSNQKIFILYSCQAAEKAISGYSNQCKDKTKINKHQISELKLLLVQNYIQLNQNGNATQALSDAEDAIVEWFGKIKHPIKGLYFYNLGLIKISFYQQILKILKVFIEESAFNIMEMKIIIQGLAMMKPELWKQMDLFNIGQISNLIPFFKYYLVEAGDNSIFDCPKSQYTENDAKTILDEVLQNNMAFDLSGITEFIDAENSFKSFEADNFLTNELSSLIFKIQNDKLKNQVE
ncbi:unnamed protein product (macronuclear) [Paramecium tetraurelia]|uniref:Anoctamin transmembrane domain-containing protein n=1 Tax=Paramecium tetraurelia TaxID=5888 RepID=A0EAT8_PARTE|nr:uncharacterized protein GSPATT00025139001 [Paramecium tetraurelia]CAK92405.1 unnamed protein product [Paramecium tetraurelia]|eukprot:XP_001459802.1 hypothetical protein (macronuclear) [Paramecium tetraurelia strain d4-2]